MNLTLDSGYLSFFVYFLLIVIILLLILVFLISHRAKKHAKALFATWKKEEFNRIHDWLMKEADARAQVQAQALFKEWKSDEEQNIRQDAVKRSHSVLKGKMTEHLIPFFSEFPYNPSDARFIGSPLDFIVFDGLSEGSLKQLVFVEVKTGTSSLSSRERSVARVIKEKKIEFQVIRKE